MSRLTKSLLLLALAVLVSVTSAVAQDKNSPACCVRVPILKHRWDNPKQLKPDSMSQNQIDWWQKDSTVVDPQNPPVENVKADERDPEDVKYEHELWKRLQGKYWRAETDPSTWPKFLRATTTNSYPERKNLWQVESIYTIRANVTTRAGISRLPVKCPVRRNRFNTAPPTFLYHPSAANQHFIHPCCSAPGAFF